MNNKVSGFVFGDTETSGLSFINTNVIQVGLIAEDEDLQYISKLDLNINIPIDADWDLGAEEVHGISRETALVHGVSQKEAVLEINSFMDRNFGKRAKKTMLVGANSYFDYVMLQNMYEKNDAGNSPWGYRLFDIGQAGLMIGKGNSLNKVLDSFGIEIDPAQAHNASYDAQLHRMAFHALDTEYQKNGLSFF